MTQEFVPYELAVKLKELGFDEPCFNRFYTKPQSKMFGVDEKGRHYPIKNTSKKLYTMGEDFVLNDSNVILAPTFSQAFRWFREKYKLLGTPQYFTGGYYCYTINDMKNTKESNRLFTEFKTFEEAELACLNKLIEIVESKSE